MLQLEVIFPEPTTFAIVANALRPQSLGPFVSNAVRHVSVDRVLGEHQPERSDKAERAGDAGKHDQHVGEAD